MFAQYVFCCFLLAGPLHLMSLQSFLGMAADALALLIKECSDAENILFAGTCALRLLYSLGDKIHVSLCFVH